MESDRWYLQTWWRIACDNSEARSSYWFSQRIAGPFQDQVSENCTFFRLSSEGQCALRKKAGGEWSQPLDWQPSIAVRSGRSSSRVELIRQQDRFSFLVNGTLVIEQTGISFGAMEVGLYVETFEEGGVAVAFDDLSIWSMP